MLRPKRPAPSSLARVSRHGLVRDPCRRCARRIEQITESLCAGRAVWTLCRAVLVLLVLLLPATPVAADDLSAFEAARARYERHEYARAVEAFGNLVGTDPPRVSNALLVLESRKYFAASLLFVGAKEEARAQFRLLLQQEPDYTLDPLAFPTEVVAMFDEVKESVRHEFAEQRAAEKKREQEAQLDLLAAEQLRRSSLLRLRSLAESRELLVQNSRWIASVPFGVGQFQNGDRGLGVAFAMAQGLAVVTSVVSYAGHQRVADNNPTSAELPETRRIEQLWRTTNLISFTTFAALALVGVIDAHVRFVPSRVRATTRPLPTDLELWLKQQGKAVGPVWRF